MRDHLVLTCCIHTHENTGFNSFHISFVCVCVCVCVCVHACVCVCTRTHVHVCCIVVCKTNVYTHIKGHLMNAFDVDEAVDVDEAGDVDLHRGAFDEYIRC